jgi:hypothetical protein
VGWPAWLATWRLVVGGSTAGLWTEGVGATGRGGVVSGGGMGADWELAVAANQGTAR